MPTIRQPAMAAPSASRAPGSAGCTSRGLLTSQANFQRFETFDFHLRPLPGNIGHGAIGTNSLDRCQGRLDDSPPPSQKRRQEDRRNHQGSQTESHAPIVAAGSNRGQTSVATAWSESKVRLTGSSSLSRTISPPARNLPRVRIEKRNPYSRYGALLWLGEGRKSSGEEAW